jgi:immunoglobulin-like protein involved in spore germination
MRAASSFRFSAALLAALSLAACGSDDDRDVCAGADSTSAFVFVETPVSGEHVDSGFPVTGCSNTFEGTVSWRLRDRAGRELAKGFTQGGSREPGAFSFSVRFDVDATQIGRLEVYEPRVTTEGFPPVRNVIPVVLGA